MNTQPPVRLKLEDAAIGFDHIPLQSVDLEIEPENCWFDRQVRIGKTTLLRTAAGLVSPLSGSSNAVVQQILGPEGAIGLIPKDRRFNIKPLVTMLMGAFGRNFLQTALSLPSKKMRKKLVL